MKSRRVLLATVAILFSLLIVLGGLQYAWTGEISRSEKENLQNRLSGDGKRFATDFNREIRDAVFTFQVDPAILLGRDWTAFNAKFDLWKSRASYPDLIENIYFVVKDSAVVSYDLKNRKFVPVQPVGELQKIQKILQENSSLSLKQTIVSQAVIVDNFWLLLPNYSSTKKIQDGEKGKSQIQLNLSGYTVIKLNEQIVKKILADLTEKYFPENYSSGCQVSISAKNSDLIYSNKQLSSDNLNESDVSLKLFDLSATVFTMYIDKADFPENINNIIKEKEIVLPSMPTITENDSVKAKITDKRKAQSEVGIKGEWLLNIRHTDGSLEDFIANTRRKNLTVSFGILSLLGISIFLIFLSANRARISAQRQLNFVSSVSHEFRTPLAVIYSPSENLSDGIVKEQQKIIEYGKLINSEGKKLSAMVEQILEFAGAHSGRRKYDFQETDVIEILETVLAEEKANLERENVTVEKNLQSNLPFIKADRNALKQVFHNVISNAVKYGSGQKKIEFGIFGKKDFLEIVVKDNGRGISGKDLKHIFEPFYRARSVVEDQIHGNGPGLSLVKEIIEVHGGKVTAESQVGGGSKFILSFPILKQR